MSLADTRSATLADILDGFPTVVLDAGVTAEERALANVSLVYVATGLVVLRSTIPGSTRRTITCHAGWGSVILPPEPDESLVALTDVDLITISHEARERLLGSPEAARLLLDGLAKTLRQKHAAIASMSRLHHVDRVREKLIELARDHGRVGRDGIRLDFPLTHDLLGEMTGSARETVTRALDELQREGFVQRNGRIYRLHVSPDELEVRERTLRR